MYLEYFINNIINNNNTNNNNNNNNDNFYRNKIQYENIMDR